MCTIQSSREFDGFSLVQIVMQILGLQPGVSIVFRKRMSRTNRRVWLRREGDVRVLTASYSRNTCRTMMTIAGISCIDTYRNIGRNTGRNTYHSTDRSTGHSTDRSTCHTSDHSTCHTSYRSTDRTCGRSTGQSSTSSRNSLTTPRPTSCRPRLFPASPGSCWSQSLSPLGAPRYRRPIGHCFRAKWVRGHFRRTSGAVAGVARWRVCAARLRHGLCHPAR